jgi:hypothetical protein
MRQYVTLPFDPPIGEAQGGFEPRPYDLKRRSPTGLRQAQGERDIVAASETVARVFVLCQARVWEWRRGQANQMPKYLVNQKRPA